MSILTPKPYQKFNYTTVIDRKFRLAHGLTQTQTEVIAYLVMIVQSWKALIFVDEYFVILTSKLKNDLLLGEKTIEASITKLKQLGLIETQLVKVPDWSSNDNFRGVKITELGKTYSLSHYKPKFLEEMSDLKEENRELTLKYDAMIIQSQNSENLNQKAIEVLSKEVKTNEKIILLEHELREVKEKLKVSMEISDKQSTTIEQNEKDLDKFRKKITNEFSKTGKPICNVVTNEDGWSPDVEFYINSFNKISIYTTDNKFKQIVEPKQINNLWRWLFVHQHRVGKVLDTKKVADISHLLKFEGQSIVSGKNIYKIHKLTPVIGGLIVQLQDKEGKFFNITTEFGREVVDLGRFEAWVGLTS